MNSNLELVIRIFDPGVKFNVDVHAILEFKRYYKRWEGHVCANNGKCTVTFSRRNIDNEDFVDFSLKSFNWSIFANEFKWYRTDPHKGNFQL